MIIKKIFAVVILGIPLMLLISLIVAKGEERLGFFVFLILILLISAAIYAFLICAIPWAITTLIA